MLFVEALKAEISDLERELESNPTYIKLREARRLLGMYSRADADHSMVPQRAAAERTFVNGQSIQSGHRPFLSGTAALVVSSVTEMLRGRATPTPTREILQYLVDKNVEVGGATPQNALSSILSKSPEFVAHGRSGWTLAVPEDHETEKADDAAPGGDTSSALFENRLSQPVEPQAKGREAVPGGGT